MRRVVVTGVLIALAGSGCGADGSLPTEAVEIGVPVFRQGAGGGRDGVKNFRTHAKGAEEVPPNDSRAQGQAIFQLSKDGTELSYKLIVANIENVTQAHIHLGPRGENGPVIAWLYPSEPPAALIPGRTQGVLAQGVITDDGVVGPLAGAGLAGLLLEMLADNTYVNVHTSQFPPGEVRGQID